MSKLPPETSIGTVSLTVSNLEQALQFYVDVLGLKLHQRETVRAVLGVGGPDLLILTEVPGSRLVQKATGLYHFAILVPTRRDLALVMRQLASSGARLQGFSDHLVSEAIYLSDPDGNGIEVYRDRQRSEWPFENGQLQMATLPLDIQALMAELSQDDPGWSGLPANTRIGHIHLQVADIAASEAFYQDLLGFDLMVRYGTAASFLAAGGYHHHIGVNIWAGTNVPPPPPDAVGLRWFSIDLPTASVLTQVVEQLQQADWPLELQNGNVFVRDPSQIGILLRHP